MRTQNYIPTKEVICINSGIDTTFETKNWLTADNIQKGDRLKISQTQDVNGVLAIKAEGKTHFHPAQKFAPITSFVDLADMKFTKADVGRKIEIKGKHYVSQSQGYRGGDLITKVEPRTTKTYTIIRVNEGSLSVDFAGKTTDRSVRLSYSVNRNYNAAPKVRFK